jgi:serine/threonine protein phosphatase PrpC
LSEQAEDYGAALAKAFLKTDAKILSEAEKKNWDCGSTGVACFFINNMLYFANVGDSEAIIGNNRNIIYFTPVKQEGNSYNHVLLTQKHSPSDPTEKARVLKAGGRIIFGRVMGMLAVCRSFGDKDFKVN